MLSIVLDLSLQLQNLFKIKFNKIKSKYRFKQGVTKLFFKRLLNKLQHLENGKNLEKRNFFVEKQKWMSRGSFFEILVSDLCSGIVSHNTLNWFIQYLNYIFWQPAFTKPFSLSRFVDKNENVLWFSLFLLGIM